MYLFYISFIILHFTFTEKYENTYLAIDNINAPIFFIFVETNYDNLEKIKIIQNQIYVLCNFVLNIPN